MAQGFAFFRMQAGVVQRSEGGNALRRAAYQAAEELTDELTGEVFDHQDKAAEIHDAEILAPEDSPGWVHDRQQLWQRAETAERRVDAQTARTLDFSIPREVPQSLWTPFARHMLQPYVEQGMVADFAVHNELASDGQAQPHVSAVLTMRRLDEAGPQGFDRKKERAWNDQFADFAKKAGLKNLPQATKAKDFRREFEQRANEFFDGHDLKCKVTLASNAEVGKPEPQPHKPKAQVREEQRLAAAVAEIDGEIARLPPEPKPARPTPEPVPAPSNVVQFQPAPRPRDLAAETRAFVDRARDQAKQHTAEANKIKVPAKAGLAVRELYEIKRDLQQRITDRKTLAAGAVAELVERRDQPWGWRDWLSPAKWSERADLNTKVLQAQQQQRQVDAWAAERTTWLDSEPGRNAIANIETQERKAARKADQPHNDAQRQRRPHVEAAAKVAAVANDAAALMRLTDDATATPEAKAEAKALLQRMIEHSPDKVPDQLRQQAHEAAGRYEERQAFDAKIERMAEITAKAAAQAKAVGPPPPAPAPPM